MNRDELTVLLLDLEERHKWSQWNISELDDGRVKFTIERPTQNSEIYFDNYEDFTDFISKLSAFS